MSTLTLLEAFLFASEVIWISDWKRLQAYDQTNAWAEEDLGNEKNFVINVLWHIHCSHPLTEKDVQLCQGVEYYRFDFLLAAITFLSWMRFLFFLKVSKTYGPLFKIVWENVKDLLKFFVIWSLLILMFICVGYLLFTELQAFQSLFSVFMIFLDSGLGNWSLHVYDTIDPEMVPTLHNQRGHVIEPDAGNVKIVGRVYHVVFLLINAVILLNMLVGILGNTYAYFNETSHGLYYDVLLQNFPLYQYHDSYGFIACA